jgi:hypothetical protein
MVIAEKQRGKFQTKTNRYEVKVHPCMGSTGGGSF